jgi:hypothetical protein
MSEKDLQPHEYRVIDERDDLKGKVERLYAFTGMERFHRLPLSEQYNMVQQLNYMRGYLLCLDKRILAFK